jgi:hypothetical protein
MARIGSTGATNETQEPQPAVPQVRPWLRYWARMFDISVFGFVVGLIAVVVPSSNFGKVIANTENELWIGMALLIAWVFVEALLLYAIGTTPGKWLFKIQLISATGASPTFPDAFSRSVAVWWRGLGAGFPLVSLFTLMTAHKRLTERGITSWDADNRINVVHGQIGLVRGFAAVAFFATAIFLISNSGATREIESSQEMQEVNALITSLQEEVSRTERSAADSDVHPLRTERRPSDELNARGAIGEIQRFVLELLDRVDAQQNDYLLELDAIQWDSILDSRRIKRDNTLEQSRVMLEQARAIVNKYEAKTATMIRDMRARVQTLPFSGDERKEIVASFDRGMKNARLEEQWSLEKRVIGQVEKIIELLATSKLGTGWIVESDQILFASDDDLATFNSYFEEIQSIVQLQEQIRKDCVEHGKQNLEAAKRLLTGGN